MQNYVKTSQYLQTIASFFMSSAGKVEGSNWWDNVEAITKSPCCVSFLPFTWSLVAWGKPILLSLCVSFFFWGGGGGGGWQESRTSPRVIYNVLLILSVFAGTRYLLSTKIKVIVRIVSQFTITFIQGRSTLLALQIFLLNKILFFLLPWLYWQKIYISLPWSFGHNIKSSLQPNLEFSHYLF